MPKLKELESRKAETRKKKVKDAKDRLPDSQDVIHTIPR
jgi:hypothetical protein